MQRHFPALAVKDDEKLLNAVIAGVYEQMMSLNQPRAERVMGLIIRRNRDAKEALKAMLRDLSRCRALTGTP